MVVQESDILKALYILGPVGLTNLEVFLQNRYDRIDSDALHITLARLVQRGAVQAKQIEGVYLWALPGTWT